MLQNWRWGEQWIPHGAWYLLAIISQFAHFTAHGEENQ
ncbi:glucosamine-link cellobiase [Vibrio cholerae]|nr:glucosamine-link cellobiase [Vibrio cholerae]